MCLHNAENVNHLFLHCPVAADLWNSFYSIFGLSWVTPQSVKAAYDSWFLWKVDKAIRRIWKMIPATIFWCIWTERNRGCFDGVSTPACFLKEIVPSPESPDNSAKLESSEEETPRTSAKRKQCSSGEQTVPHGESLVG